MNANDCSNDNVNIHAHANPNSDVWSNVQRKKS